MREGEFGDVREEEDEDKDIYSEKGAEELIDNDEITAEEEGFMRGAHGGGQGAKCRRCGKIIIEKEDAVEKEIDGELYLFCSDKCAEDYEKK